MAKKNLFGVLQGNKPFSGGPKSLKSKMDDLVKNRPQYNVQDEAMDTLALAKGRAFGKDRAIQMAEENVDQDVATNIGQAKSISSNTGSILDTLRSVTDSGLRTKRGLAQDQAEISNQRVGDLYNANQMMSEEKDKAWNYNVNDPYQNKVQALRDKRKFRQELLFKGLDFVGSLGGMAIGNAMGGGKSSGGNGLNSDQYMSMYGQTNDGYNPATANIG